MKMTHLAAAVRSIIHSDAKHFEPIVQTDTDALIVDAKKFGFDLVVFTNELALSRRFISVESGITTSQEFEGLESSTNPALLFSPLAVPENLGRALRLALKKSEFYASFDFILVSHGTKHFAAVPRIAADFLTLGSGTPADRKIASVMPRPPTPQVSTPPRRPEWREPQ